MILMLHIIIAISTIGLASYAAARASQGALRMTHLGAAFTALSGAGMVAMGGVSIMHACVSGILTLALVYALVIVTHRRLSASAV